MTVQVEAVRDPLLHYVLQVPRDQDDVLGSSSAPREEPELSTFNLDWVGHSLQGLFRDFDAIAVQSASVIASTMEDSLRCYAEAASAFFDSFDWLKSSTEIVERPKEVDAEIHSLLQRASGQTFEAGMESEFSRGLVHIVRKYGDDAIGALADRIGSEAVSPAVAAEALQWLAVIDDDVAYLQRLLLLERSLNSSSPWVRDGAGLGLAHLDDPHAIPYVAYAVERETIPELRDDLELVLTQLENALGAAALADSRQA